MAILFKGDNLRIEGTKAYINHNQWCLALASTGQVSSIITTGVMSVRKNYKYVLVNKVNEYNNDDDTLHVYTLRVYVVNMFTSNNMRTVLQLMWKSNLVVSTKLKM